MSNKAGKGTHPNFRSSAIADIYLYDRVSQQWAGYPSFSGETLSEPYS